MNEKEALKLLKKYSSSARAFKAVVEHVKVVQKLALEFAEDTDADKEFIKIASLLHDIGRFNSPPGSKDSLHHGIKGSTILRNGEKVNFSPTSFSAYSKAESNIFGKVIPEGSIITISTP